MSDRIQQGEMVKCDECRKARPIQQPPIEMFGNRIGFGPAGENDMFVEREGVVKCKRCSEQDIDL